MPIRSHCTGHFPSVRFVDHERKLWQPVTNQLLADRPEERVRLRSIDYFEKRGVCPTSLIAVEKSGTLRGKLAKGRTDLLIYDRELKPLLLLEFKSPAVSIGVESAQQIARYNMDVGAPFLCLSNGLLDYWFEMKPDDCIPLSKIPPRFTGNSNWIPTLDYWVSTGFVGTISSKAPHISHLVTAWFSGEAAQNVISLNPKLPHTLAGLTHYYQVVEDLKTSHKIAFTLLSGDGTNTYLIAIKNVRGRNEAVLFLHLDPLYLGKDLRFRILKAQLDLEVNVDPSIQQYLLNAEDEYSTLPVYLDAMFSI